MMIIPINANHHDLEVVYAYRYSQWLQHDNTNKIERSRLLAAAMNNLITAGYEPHHIQLIERGVKRSQQGGHSLTRQRVDAYLDTEWEGE